MTRRATKSLITSVIAAGLFSGAASANIGNALHSVCAKAKQTDRQALTRLASDSQSYQNKLATYYAGMSCQGKSLVSLSGKTQPVAGKQSPKANATKNTAK